MEKLVSQLDASGWFVGQVKADPSPLEPGVYLLPGGSVDIPPPEALRQDKRYLFQDGGWLEEDAPQLAGPDGQQLKDAALAQRDNLLQYATLRMAPLLDAIELEMATEEERATLIAWRQHRIQLNRIELQPDFPESIAWPQPPDA
ncbi:tail fiber assembly protein [Achromobacter seleniivolatilans]|uniref:Tail fiber assembly protein n=1 Tax=Achromobacter seleniivolatilans TaxID=3047478 RepID=A0ABY9M8D5_9BURK|nr:tail fiber assembly protein [Achromobacter sp. R39]WMD23110.1 tail fiber assembly protein [Achromobacter sp. R39]